jgi:Fic family protein
MVEHIWHPETGITEIEVDWHTIRATEVESIRIIWGEQRARLGGSQLLSDFTERLSREWAIETGIIENLYDIDRGVTQTLIEHGFQAELLGHGTTNRPREYVVRLLNDQKDALDGVFDFVAHRKELSTSYIKELHAALLRSQTHTDAIDPNGKSVLVPLIRGDWKVQPNSPTRDGQKYEYCPPGQVASEMDRLVGLHLAHKVSGVSAEVQAAWLHHRFTQVHPFQDGNGRVARALASLVLVQAGLFPLVVTRDDKIEYLDALEDADQGHLKRLIDLISKLQKTQFLKATAISEQILSAETDVQQVLGGLNRAAERLQDQRTQALQVVFAHARELAGDTDLRLQRVVTDILNALRRVAADSSVYITRSGSQTDHYYRSQIVENAKNRFGYFADTNSYRAWICLNMVWQRRAKLVFAFHGVGRPFSGSLICAPFLEFQDTEEDGQTRDTLVPVADEGFVFFYNETEQEVLARFRNWRERVLVIALRELINNL